MNTETVAETPLNYDLSLRLKELGFDEPCIFAHLSDGLGDTYSGYVNTLFKPKICSAPYPSQVIRWLRIVHGLELSIGATFDGGYMNGISYIFDGNKSKAVEDVEGYDFWEMKKYDTHPLAELAGIEQALIILQKRLDNGQATD